MLSSLDTTGIKFRFDSVDVIRGETDFTGNTYHCDSAHFQSKAKHPTASLTNIQFFNSI